MGAIIKEIQHCWKKPHHKCQSEIWMSGTKLHQDLRVAGTFVYEAQINLCPFFGLL